jgi:predicted SprT family Zn-dependent metalloprotease
MADAVLKAKLETLLVRELACEYTHVNRVYFKGAMTPPQIALVSSRTHLGRWIKETRVLELSRPFLLEQPWGAVIEVLKHEIAHQYVHEVLGEHAQTPHGPAFRATCARLGIDAAASGVPRAVETTPEQARVVEKIARLLALAESPNQHEAEAAAAQAQRLMLKHNLDVNEGARTHGRAYAFRHLGEPTGRVSEAERILAMLLGMHFFVEVIWVPVYRPLAGKRGSVLEVCGTSANLEIAEYVHQFLTHTAERLWVEHKRARGIAGNRDRRTYLAGVMAGFAEKLGRQANVHREEGLVWVKDADLGTYLRARHPHIRHVRHTGAQRNEAFTHGRRAGHGIVIHRGVTAAGENRGHLLPPRR